jgi:hypothetical protein
MKIQRLTVAAFLGAFLLLAIALVGFAGSSSAAPYGGNGLIVTVTTPDPGPGSNVGVNITGGNPGDSIVVDIDSTPVRLAKLPVGPGGAATGTLAIPCSFSGAHAIVATDETTSQTGSVQITVDPKAASSACNLNTLLASTGVSITGFSPLTVGGSLLVAGSALLFFGRRRTRERGRVEISN